VLTEKYLQYIKMYEESLKLFVKQGESKYSPEQLTEFEKNLLILEDGYSEMERML